MSKKSVEQQSQDELREMEQQFPSIPHPETETLFVPLDPNGNSDSIYLCVNGKNMVVKRGEQVEIPAAFAEAYRNAQAQQAAALRAQQAALSKG